MVVADDAYARLLEKIADQSDELGVLEDSAAQATRQAYLAARDDIASRMEELISSRGGLDELSGRDRFRLTRDAGLVQTIEGRLSQLGGEHESIVSQKFTDATQLANKHLPLEIGSHLEQIRKVHGESVPSLTAIDFGRLDTAAQEIGLGVAVRDVKALSAATQVDVTRRIQQGVASGEGIRSLTRRLDVLPEISTQRGEVISRWATIKGYNLSRQAAYEVAETTVPGIMKMWLASRDERTCPHCLAQHGTTVAVKEEFPGDRTYAASPPNLYEGFLEHPPLHPRCRCTITSWTEEWRAFTNATPEELQVQGLELAKAAGHPRAVITQAGKAGVQSATQIGTRILAAAGDRLTGVQMLDDFSATVRFASEDIDEVRLSLRNAGFRVRRVDGADDLLRVDLPEGIPIPRLLRSTKLRALPAQRWDMIRDGLLRCARD